MSIFWKTESTSLFVLSLPIIPALVPIKGRFEWRPQSMEVKVQCSYILKIIPLP